MVRGEEPDRVLRDHAGHSERLVDRAIIKCPRYTEFRGDFARSLNEYYKVSGESIVTGVRGRYSFFVRGTAISNPKRRTTVEL